MSFFTDIIHRFGVPNSIITDNNSQFTGRKFLEFCDDHHIYVDWAAVAHPQTNGQVERANGMILQGLKPRIFDRLNKSGRKWLQELPSIIWSLRTTPSRATRFTPFFLVYGAKAVLPTDLGYRSPKVKGYDETSNQRAREDSLDQIDEARDVAPPPKRSLFSQKSVLQKALSTSQPGSLGKKTRDVSGQRTKTGESGIVYASGRIQPFPLTTLPMGCS
jgi:transposase InsO family protein